MIDVPVLTVVSDSRVCCASFYLSVMAPKVCMTKLKKEMKVYMRADGVFFC